MRVSSGSGPSNPSLTSWSMAARNAANVLPDPVGAATNTCCRDCSAGHACSCAAVGASKVRENHAATAGCRMSSAFMACSVLLSLRQFLEIVQTSLVDPAHRVHRGFVVFIVGGIVADVLALEVPGPSHRGFILARGFDGQGRRIAAHREHTLDDGIFELAARRI